MSGRAKVLATVLVLAAFGVGRLSVQRSTASVVREAPVASPARPVVLARGIDRAEVEDAVRAAMNRVAGAPAQQVAAAPADDEGKPESAPEPAPEIVRARAEAGRVVDQALARERWTAQDRDAIRGLGGDLDADAIAGLYQRLIPAVNAQRVAIDVRGPLF
jgi:hypothetical protein